MMAFPQWVQNLPEYLKPESDKILELEKLRQEMQCPHDFFANSIIGSSASTILTQEFCARQIRMKYPFAEEKEVLRMLLMERGLPQEPYGYGMTQNHIDQIIENIDDFNGLIDVIVKRDKREEMILPPEFAGYSERLDSILLRKKGILEKLKDIKWGWNKADAFKYFLDSHYIGPHPQRNAIGFESSDFGIPVSFVCYFLRKWVVFDSLAKIDVIFFKDRPNDEVIVGKFREIKNAIINTFGSFRDEAIGSRNFPQEARMSELSGLNYDNSVLLLGLYLQRDDISPEAPCITLMWADAKNDPTGKMWHKNIETRIQSKRIKWCETCKYFREISGWMEEFFLSEHIVDESQIPCKIFAQTKEVWKKYFSGNTDRRTLYPKDCPKWEKRE